MKKKIFCSLLLESDKEYNIILENKIIVNRNIGKLKNRKFAASKNENDIFIFENETIEVPSIYRLDIVRFAFELTSHDIN
jgi:Lhr-like helicase